MIQSKLLAFIFLQKHCWAEKSTLTVTFTFKVAFISNVYKILRASCVSQCQKLHVFPTDNTIVTAMLASNASTDFTGRDASDPILLGAAPPVATVIITVTTPDLSSFSGAMGSSVGLVNWLIPMHI